LTDLLIESPFQYLKKVIEEAAAQDKEKADPKGKKSNTVGSRFHV